MASGIGTRIADAQKRGEEKKGRRVDMEEMEGEKEEEEKEEGNEGRKKR